MSVESTGATSDHSMKADLNSRIKDYSISKGHTVTSKTILSSGSNHRIIVFILTQLLILFNAGLQTNILNAELVLFCFSAATGT